MDLVTYRYWTSSKISFFDSKHKKTIPNQIVVSSEISFFFMNILLLLLKYILYYKHKKIILPGYLLLRKLDKNNMYCTPVLDCH